MGTKNKKIVDGYAEGSKRILMIGAYKPQIAGLPHVVINLVRILKKKHKIYVINMGKAGKSVGFRHWRDGEVEVYQERFFYRKKFTTIQTLFQTTKRAWLLRKKVDIYHTHGLPYSGISLLDKKKPLVLTLHGYSTLETVAIGRIKPDSLGFRLMLWMEKKAVARADAVIAVGKALKDWIIQDLGADADKVFYVPNGVNGEEFRFDKSKGENIRRRLSYSETDKVITFVKALSEQNGIRYFINALPLIKKRYPNLRLIVLGDGPLRKEMERIVIKNELSDNVRFIGRVPNEEVPSYLSASDIFILPSIPLGGAKETFGISLIEAMACELPVIATSVGGPKEILEDGKVQMGKDVGILIPPKDPKAIADKVIYLLEHPEEAREMGKRAREYVVNNYTWEKNAEKVLEVYKHAIEHHNRK